MLEFIETLLNEVRKLREDTYMLLINGGVRDMEQYKFLMGRLEGYKLVEEVIQTLLRRADD